jgi:hypothetical protein
MRPAGSVALSTFAPSAPNGSTCSGSHAGRYGTRRCVDYLGAQQTNTYLVPMFALVESPDVRTAESIDDSVAALRDEMMPHAWRAIDGARVALLFDETLRTVVLPDGEEEGHTVVDSHPTVAALVVALRSLLDATLQRDAPRGRKAETLRAVDAARAALASIDLT